MTTRGATRLLIAGVSNGARRNKDKRNQDKEVALHATPRTFPCPARHVAPSVNRVDQPPGAGHAVGGKYDRLSGVSAHSSTGSTCQSGCPGMGGVCAP